MVKDYPDYTDIMQIIGADIMVPIDIQGAYIMMPVDIQAQYINLAIDIVAQTIGNIAVNIAAADIGNIGIDIKANTLGNLTIDIEAQSIGVHLQPEWAALQGTDKGFNALTADLATGLYTSATYAVPEGATLYIAFIAGWCTANLAADRDNNQMMAISIYDETAGSYLFFCGGNGGAIANLTKPIVIPAEHTVWFMCWNFANHNCDVRVSAGGWEV